MFLQSQYDKIYDFFGAKLPKMRLENSLKFFLIVNLVLIFYSVFNFFTIILVPIFGFLVYQMWQNLHGEIFLTGDFNLRVYTNAL